MTTIRDLIPAYERHMRVERDLSDKTRAAYLYDLGRFEAFAGPVALESVTPESIAEFLDSLPGPSTRARSLASVAGLFKFAVRSGLIPSSPADHVSRPAVRMKLPKFLPVQDVATILEAIPLDYPTGLRDFAIISTLAFAGLRLSEVAGLNLRDARPDVGTLRVRGKGNKERIVPMHPAVGAALAAWLAARPKVDTDALFVSRFNARIANRTVENVCKVRGAAAGFPDLHPCMLRHTFATILHGNGVDLLQIQALLGHASVSSTAIYTHTDASRLAASVATIRP